MFKEKHFAMGSWSIFRETGEKMQLELGNREII